MIVKAKKSIICPVCGIETFYKTKGKCKRCYTREYTQSPKWRAKLEAKRKAYYAGLREKRRLRITSKAPAVPSPSSDGSLLHPKGLTAKQLRNRRKAFIKRMDKKFQIEGETHWCQAGSKSAPEGHWHEQTCSHHIKSRRFKETRYDECNKIRLCLEHHALLHRMGKKFWDSFFLAPSKPTTSVD